MEGFGLLVGHLLGDYIFQNDWMAKWKTAPPPGPRPELPLVYTAGMKGQYLREETSWQMRRSEWQLGHLACFVHCLIYTLCVWACSSSWLPWWGLVVCFLTHFVIDRFRLARRLMAISGQEQFATGALSPWSIIVVDNTLHLLTLYLIGLGAGL